MKKAFWILPVLCFTACVNKVSHHGQKPEEVVRAFVELSVGAKDFNDRVKLQQVCVGEMRRTFERMNEEAFRLIYLDSKLKLVTLEILKSETTGASAKITYKVSVENQQGTDPTRETNSREVELTQTQGAWYIENIHLNGSDQVAFTRGMIF